MYSLCTYAVLSGENWWHSVNCKYGRLQIVIGFSDSIQFVFYEETFLHALLLYFCVVKGTKGVEGNMCALELKLASIL